MKINKIIKVPEQEKEVLDKMICDLCGKESTHKTFNYENYRLEEIEVRMKTGIDYPECGYGTEVKFDICPECFTTKLIPWMKSQGATPTEREWEY